MGHDASAGRAPALIMTIDPGWIALNPMRFEEGVDIGFRRTQRKALLVLDRHGLGG